MCVQQDPLERRFAELQVYCNVLKLPVCAVTRFILVRPHYPENVGAAARALKTMGITDLCLVRPGRLAVPSHDMARKMAVKSWEVLDAAQCPDTLGEALRGFDTVFATSSRRGQRDVRTARVAADFAVEQAQLGRRIAIVMGNEKTGLSQPELEQCQYRLRIPMAGDQPSVNLAQACQLIAYEWFMAGLEARIRENRDSTEER